MAEDVNNVDLNSVVGFKKLSDPATNSAGHACITRLFWTEKFFAVLFFPQFNSHLSETKDITVTLIY